jgi:prepilin-type N-terminal cleavage/methylation domain-containing protein
MFRTSVAQRGWTLVELLVVISVLGIILAFFIPPIVSRVTNNARVVATRQELNVLREAIAGNSDVIAGGQLVAAGFRNDVGRLPRNLIELATRNPFEGIYAPVMYVGKETLPAWDPYLKKGWNGPYVREWLTATLSRTTKRWGWRAPARTTCSTASRAHASTTISG